MPPTGSLVLIGLGAIVLAAAVGMLALRDLVRRPASELVRWE